MNLGNKIVKTEKEKRQMIVNRNNSVATNRGNSLNIGKGKPVVYNYCQGRPINESTEIE